MILGVAAWLSAAFAHGEPGRRPRISRARGPRVMSSVSNAAESARQFVVVLERGGRQLSLGFVLADDGRILTARSPLGDLETVDIRYADGVRVRARIEHSDSAWDLALVTPSTPHETEGLPASESSAASGKQLAAFAGSGQGLRATPVLVRGRTSYFDKKLRQSDALELAGSLGPSDLGTPIVDETGAVVALATRGCLLVQGGDACLPAPVGAPVAALRKFLSTAPEAAPAMPWLGARVVADATPYARGLRIEAVQPASPAERAGLRGGPRDRADLVVAIDGQPTTTPEMLAEAIRDRAVGDLVTLLVFGLGQFREVSVVLEAAPSD